MPLTRTQDESNWFSGSDLQANLRFPVQILAFDQNEKMKEPYC